MYRGSSLPDEHRQFFDEMLERQTLYRVPMLLASSFMIEQTNSFLDEDRHGSLPRVRFTIELDSVQRCSHVNFIANSEVANEKEFLFAAWSAFRVKSINWSNNPTRRTSPHEITIVACPDNRDVSEDVPTAPWH